MKSKYLSLFIGLTFSTSLLISGFSEKGSVKSSERNRLFNSGWKFIRDSIAGAEQPGFDDSKWTVIDLPHDYSIMHLPGEDGTDKIGPFSKKSPGNGNSTGQVIGGTGWYRKSFTLDKTDEEKTAILYFDGIYMESEIWVNGKKAGVHKNGYTPFWFNITSMLNSGGKTNVIAVKVDNEGRNSRWYSGSGIYRNVQLTLVQPVHVAVWGVKITTSEIRQNSAIVDIAVTTRNEKEQKLNAFITINIKDKDGLLAGSAKEEIVLSGKSDNITKKELEIKNPLLWSVEFPNIYIAEIIIEVNNKETDEYNQDFGIRSIEFSAEKGFLLNGKSVKLKGGCLHHDNGFLGSAAFDRAEVRRVEIMKANGYNAIRCAHNPPSEVFLDACDRLGMIVINEFSDMWEYYKNPQDYSRFFSEWWNSDLTAMIMRDRNHPSIIMWSIGNEIYEKNDSSRLRISKQLADRVRELDSTRAVTQAITGFFYPAGWDSTAPVFALLDVSGYNYNWEKFESDHQKYPQRIMYTSESFAKNAFDYWKVAERNSYVIGDFVWTSMDYLGEVSLGSTSYVPATQKRVSSGNFSGYKLPEGVNIFDLQAKRPSAWPYFVAGSGDIDITGEKRPQMLYRDVLWDNSKVEINVHAPIPKGYSENISGWGWPDEWPCWNWNVNDGNPLQVRVFTRASRVRLELNGKVIGEKDLLPEDKYIAVFEVPYQSGELKAVALENGKEVATKVLKTAGEPVAIRLVADRNKITGDRNDLSFVKIEVIDNKGQVVPRDSVSVTLILSGDGELIGSGNANPADMTSVNRSKINTYKGRAQAIIRPSGRGQVKLIAEAEGLRRGELTIKLIK
jgi:beta-galactosidase